MTAPSPLFTTASGSGGGVVPEEWGDIILLPLQRESAALTTATTIVTDLHTVHVPLLSVDPTSAFVAEGDEISADDPTVSEVPITPVKVAGLTLLSRKLAMDSSPAAADLVGASLARSVVRTLDTAFLATTAVTGTHIEPDGVLVTAVTGSMSDSLDPLVDAIAAIEDADGQANVIVVAPQTWAAIAKLKAGSDSQLPLLNPYGPASQAAERQLLNIPVVVTPRAPANTVNVWDKRAIVTVLREGVTLAIGDQRYFEYDSIGVRTTLRVSWAVVASDRIYSLSFGGD